MGRKEPTPPPYKPGDKVKRPAAPPAPPQPYAMNKFGRNPPPPTGMVKPPPTSVLPSLPIPREEPRDEYYWVLDMERLDSIGE